MLKNGENPFVRDTLVHRGTDSDGNTVEIFKTTCVVPKRTKDNGRRKMANKSVGAATYKVVVHVPSVEDRTVPTLHQAREIAGVNTASKKLAVETKPKSAYPEQQTGYSRG